MNLPGVIDDSDDDDEENDDEDYKNVKINVT